MAEEKGNESSQRLYVCCPQCGKTIAQAEQMKNVIIRCEQCHNRVLIDIIDGKVITTIYRI